MAAEIHGRSTIEASKDLMSADLDGEVVILHPKSSEYFGLDEVGTRVWSLIQEPRAVNEICNAIVSEFEIGRTRCESDVIAFLNDLAAEGLVAVSQPRG